jgi:hypothetical protein
VVAQRQRQRDRFVRRHRVQRRGSTVGTDRGCLGRLVALPEGGLVALERRLGVAADRDGHETVVLAERHLHDRQIRNVLGDLCGHLRDLLWCLRAQQVAAGGVQRVQYLLLALLFGDVPDGPDDAADRLLGPRAFGDADPAVPSFLVDVVFDAVDQRLAGLHDLALFLGQFGRDVGHQLEVGQPDHLLPAHVVLPGLRQADVLEPAVLVLDEHLVGEPRQQRIQQFPVGGERVEHSGGVLDASGDHVRSNDALGVVRRRTDDVGGTHRLGLAHERPVGFDREHHDWRVEGVERARQLLAAVDTLAVEDDRTVGVGVDCRGRLGHDCRDVVVLRERSLHPDEFVVRVDERDGRFTPVPGHGCDSATYLRETYKTLTLVVNVAPATRPPPVSFTPPTRCR